MKAMFIFLCAILSFKKVLAQSDTIKALERKMRRTYNDEEKNIARQILTIDSFNIEATKVLIRKMPATFIDSFYSALIAKHPKSASPYILRPSCYIANTGIPLRSD